MKYRELHGYKYEALLDEVSMVKLSGVYDIETDYIKLTKDGVLTAKKHYAWDGPSGPAIDTKNFMRSSLMHDALYQLMREELLPRTERENCDKLMREICLSDGMSSFRAWYTYTFVRMFGEGGSMPSAKPLGKIVEI